MENDEKSFKPQLFKPGQVANPKGRGKGTPNKMTSQMKEAFTLLFKDNAPKMQDALDRLFQDSPKDWLKFWTELAPYFMPKLSTTRAELTVKSTGAENLESEELFNLILTINNPEDAEFTEQQ